MKFCSAFFGHRGSAAKNPCVVCLGQKGQLGQEIVQQRTLEQMKLDADSGTNSMMAHPLLNIGPENIIPPSLHILMGVAQRVLDLLEVAVGEENVEKLNNWLRKNHCVRNKRSRNCTGLFI